MKLFKYYGVLLVLITIFNGFFNFIIIEGIFYQAFMYIVICFNIFLLFGFGNCIKYKGIVLVLLIMSLCSQKNMLELFFLISSIFSILIIGVKGNNCDKVLSIISFILLFIYFLPIYFILMLIYSGSIDGNIIRNQIIDGTRYICNENNEAFVSFGGAMDSFHYFKGKYYEIVNFDGIINVNLSFSHEIDSDEYNNFIENKNCTLVGD